MIFGIHLREPFRFGGTGFMTLRAQYGRVRQGRHQGDWVLSVLGLGAMASLTRDPGMFALGLHLEDIAVAGLTGFVPGVDDGQSRDLRNGVAPVVSIFPKAARDEKGSNAEERHHTRHKQGGDAKQMFSVFHYGFGRNYRPSVPRRDALCFQ